jgi:hypothetical protein
MTRPCRRSAASPRGFLYTTCLTSSLSAEAAHTHSRESVLFIGTNSVPTTPQYICHPMPRDVHDVCVIVCNCVYLCSKVLGPFIPRTSLLMPFLVFRRSHFASCRKSSFRCRTSSYRPFRSSASLPALKATHIMHIMRLWHIHCGVEVTV